MKINNINNSIMKVSFVEIQNVLKKFLSHLDDFQQLAGDNNDAELEASTVQDYAVVENLYKVSLRYDLNQTQRNEVRLIMKESFKSASKYLN